jgi:mRNA-degrading endonuclease toxin of MazEF toxin-antitoxin module
MRRGELYRVRRLRDDPKRFRIYVVVSRQAVIDSRLSSVICAPVFMHGKGLSTQVRVGTEEGLLHTGWKSLPDGAALAEHCEDPEGAAHVLAEMAPAGRGDDIALLIARMRHPAA